MSEECCVVLVTVNGLEKAEEIADALVGERLAACCNLVPGIRSIYRWKDEICRDEETLMVIKAQHKLFARVRQRVLELHSYEVPEIIALPVIAGHEPYLDWIRNETEG